jgi:hypothetical protein
MNGETKFEEKLDLKNFKKKNLKEELFFWR